jgi:hypothetical protein
LVLDGTANPEILMELVPSLVMAAEIRVQRNARVIQVSNSTFFRGSLIKRASSPTGKGQWEPLPRLLEVADFIEKTARSGKTLVVTNKPVRCALTGEDEHGSLPTSVQYRGADIAHFGNIRGPTISRSTRSPSFWAGTSPASRTPNTGRWQSGTTPRSRSGGSPPTLKAASIIGPEPGATK